MEKLIQESNNRERKLPDKNIPDSLEGIIEGKSRLKRYVNFMSQVLTKIWPEDTSSGEWGNDFHRTTRYQNGNIGGYTQLSPFAHDPKTLDENQFETMVQNLGTPDYVRVISVPPQLLNEASIINVGGSCVIETNGVRTTTELRKYSNTLQTELNSPQTTKEKKEEIQQKIDIHKEYLRNVTRTLIAMAPTITHISGALLGGYDSGIHLIESDMWREKIEQEYGIPHEEANSIINDAYERIHQAVERRSKLINPESTIIPINFDDLDLLKAYVKEWTDNIGLKNVEEYRVIEVIYTYTGPHQLKLVQQTLRQKIQSQKLSKEQEKKALEMLDASFHVRGKQIDHLRWGSMDLSEELVTRKREINDEEQERFDKDPAYRMGLTLMSSAYEMHKDGAESLSVGFVDLPTFGGGVQHESRNVGFQFQGKVGENKYYESVNQQLNNPARLNNQNINQHLEFLRNYILDNTQAKKNLTQELQILQTQLKPLETIREKTEINLKKARDKIVSYKKQTEFLDHALDLINTITTNSNQFTEVNIETAKILLNLKQKSLINIQKKVNEGISSEEDKKDIERIPKLIQLFDDIIKGNSTLSDQEITKMLSDLELNTNNQLEEINSLTQNKLVEEKTITNELQKILIDINFHQPISQRIDEIKKEMSQIPSTNLFPLKDNPFIHHAMQFLWDPDFIVFIKEAVSIQENRISKVIEKDEANLQLRNLMSRLFPKLETYIRYIYGQIDYPYEMKSTSVFNINS